MVANTSRRDDVIQIRASRETKALLQRAAELKQQKLSEFMLESARRSAEETILDRNLFHLGDEAYDRFVALLDNPPQASPEVVARYRRKAPWA
ncbi:MAG: DUF1778 domain-containing protein [Proteobacteria bacterium]|nr:DUF1778 domain-containing protein [Pseudomonadota bacterium]